MIAVNEWQSYLQRLTDSNEFLEHCELVVNISQLKERVKELDITQYPLLVGVVPSADSASMDEDNISEINSLLLMVLQPIERGTDSTTELEQLEVLQNAITGIKRRVREDYFRCDMPMLDDVKFRSYATEPVYNLLGYMGWMFRFEIETSEYETF